MSRDGSPIVAIVGRPNVGKSTLFNRLVGRLTAIVAQVPGTTRDRLYAPVSWGSQQLTLVDTGGLEPAPSSEIIDQVKSQVQKALAEADVIVFVVDGRDGVTPTDEDIAQLLRRAGKPLIVAVNKVDNPQRRLEAIEFHQLGLGVPVPISAYHGTGVEDLMDEVTSLLPPPAPPTTQKTALQVAIVGRPNVGKSLLLNAILGQERAIVSPVPGTTRDAVDTLFEYGDKLILLIDTAGIRRSGRVEVGIEHYSVLRAKQAINRADVVLLVMDATEGMTAQDVHIAGFAQEAYTGLILVANKWDLVEDKEKSRASLEAELPRRLKFAPNSPLALTSALLGWGVAQVLTVALDVGEERARSSPPQMVEDLVRRAVAAHPPPFSGTRKLLVEGGRQVGVKPPTFVFQVNEPRLLHFSYQRYLENRLRQTLGFPRVPLRLVFKRKAG
ncbi:MAG: ribosome biogenesis GTPase Der [Chloroflexi bacterium]|nr:ribosome biogenesis GTPase Der [Chloroflexota bacterium]